ncbi:MAG TPA: carbohydrate kinase [Chromatiales bacterium]|nr:carbohydrate kinase [Chromatiales bacterium]
MSPSERAGRPVVFGEVLYDCFEDGARVLGGAPFNVAWHLRGFGLEPLLVSRVGDDALGREVRAAMAEWGLDEAGLQADAAHPTGTVQVRLGAGGQPSFDIVADVAWDHVDPDAAVAAARAAGPALLYHGTLAARAPRSAAALAALRGLGAPAFVDVNLRPPWWREETVRGLLDGARWAKLNDDELAALEGGRAAADAERLRARHGLEAVILTRGARGAAVAHAGGLTEAAPEPVREVADTVGAGDAFAAVAILGLMRGWGWETVLARAVAFAADICRVRGAVVRDRGLYARWLRRWEEEGA